MLQILSALCLNPDLCGIYSSETGGVVFRLHALVIVLLFFLPSLTLVSGVNV